MKNFGFIKGFDLFSIPVNRRMNIHRHDRTDNDKDYNITNFGSVFGGVITFLMIIGLLTYIGLLIPRMQHGDDDVINRFEMMNPIDTKDGIK